MKNIALIGIGGSIALPCIGTDDHYVAVGSAISGVGVLIIAGTQLAASYQTRKTRNALSSTVILKNDFKFANGSTLSASIDMLRDHSMNSNALGLQGISSFITIHNISKLILK